MGMGTSKKYLTPLPLDISWSAFPLLVKTRTPPVVCDAGPLIHLDELGALDLLGDFSKVLVIHHSVLDEAKAMIRTQAKR